MDGHCPGLGGKALNAYIAAGLKTATKVISWKKDAGNYNSAVVDDPRRVRCPQSQRTGTVVNEFNSPQCMLCTDDRNPWESPMKDTSMP